MGRSGKPCREGAVGCTCPVCRIQRALEVIDVAHDEMIDRHTETEMRLLSLKADLLEILDMSWWRRLGKTGRLLAAAIESDDPKRWEPAEVVDGPPPRVTTLPPIITSTSDTTAANTTYVGYLRTGGE